MSEVTGDVKVTIDGEPAEKWRANWLPSPHFYNLNQACALINRAFPEGMCYLVGSSLKRRDFRDVDVRFIMRDEAFDAMFGGERRDRYWSLLSVAFSSWLSQECGYPVDFQIQRQPHANQKHDGHRNALGIRVEYPGEMPRYQGLWPDYVCPEPGCGFRMVPVEDPAKYTPTHVHVEDGGGERPVAMVPTK